MADMSHDEKRAAGWRKLKKYQQHKTASHSSKSTRKKQELSTESNGETYSVFSGFSEQQNEYTSISPVPQSNQLLEQQSTSLNNLSQESPENYVHDTERRTSINSSSDVNSNCENIFSPEESLVELNSIPVAANIFPNDYSLDANNCSDFFDSINPDSKQNVGNSCLPSVSEDHADSQNPKPPITSQIKDSSAQIKDDSTKTEMLQSVEEDATLNDFRKIDISKYFDNNTDSDLKRTDKFETNVTTNKDSKQDMLSSSLVSSADSLQHLSLGMNGLPAESFRSSMSVPMEMESKNQDLAALLANEQQKCESLQQQMREYEKKVSQLQIETSQYQTEQLTRLQQDLTTAQEQLQLHVQTVGILVGEKAELEAELSKNQQIANQKANEVEELLGRLKASRHRVGDLEKELSESTDSNKHFDSLLKQQSKEITRMKLEKDILTKQLEEVEEEAAELRQTLDGRTIEVQKLQQDLQEKQSQLDLALLKVHQLSVPDTLEMEKQLEFIHRQNVDKDKQITELTHTVKNLESERDQANSQYQEYLQHINGQMKSMADKLSTSTKENEQLLNREQSLVKHLSELEKQLQQLQQQNQRNRGKDSPSQMVNLETIQRLEENILTLEEEKEKLKVILDNQIQENKLVQDELIISTNKIEELENMVESLKNDQPDTKKLLAAMESDKVAASRAVGQNLKLKDQLLELEEGFIRVSNRNMDLTEQLVKEQHLSRELGERLAQQELEISELRTQLAENENVINNLEKSSSEQLKQQILKEDQIADQMRHYEAQGHMTETLQNELHQNKERCRHLQAENNELRMKLAQATLSERKEVIEDQRNDQVDSLKASICQLTMERDQLLSQLQQSEAPLFSVVNDAPTIGQSQQEVDLQEYSNLKDAMQKLQARFTKTMEEVAELSDEKQRLEHLVLQLQGETETIGEYIALYQTQRSILRQRAQEKDEQLARLARDREEVKIKLNELNRLIGLLVVENEKNMSSIQEISGTSDNGLSNESGITLEGAMNGDVPMKQSLSEESNNIQNSHHSLLTPAKTADKIIALISEIESSTLVEPKNIEMFHPCPWCSGRLITV